MHFKNTIIALLFLFLCSCTEKQTIGNLHIKGNINGLKKGTLYIKKIVDTALVAIDTIKIDGDSHFESHLTIQSPEMYFLVIDRGITNSIDDNLPFFAEAGNISIETQLEGYYNKAKITGSKNQKLFEEYKKINSKFKDERLALTEARLTALRFNKLYRIDSIQKLENILLKRSYLFATNFALNNRNSEIAPYIALSEINDINLKYLDTIRKSMSPKVAASFYGKKLTAYYNERKKLEAQQ